MAIEFGEPNVSPGGFVTARPDARVSFPFSEHSAASHIDAGDARTLDNVESATPTTFALGSLRHPELRLRSPLTLDVQREGDQVVVSHEQLREVGRGPYLTAAVEDFQRAVGRRYLSLQSEQARLDPEQARLWETLQQWIEERR